VVGGENVVVDASGSYSRILSMYVRMTSVVSDDFTEGQQVGSRRLKRSRYLTTES
jgi:hypothetical protein